MLWLFKFSSSPLLLVYVGEKGVSRSLQLPPVGTNDLLLIALVRSSFFLLINNKYLNRLKTNIMYSCSQWWALRANAKLDKKPSHHDQGILLTIKLKTLKIDTLGALKPNIFV